MSRKCKKCCSAIPNIVTIDGKDYHLARRKYCLSCSPLFSRNHYKFRKETKPDLPVNKCCPICDRVFVYTKNDICSTCRNFYQRGKAKSRAVEYLGGACTKCGIKDIDVLLFHHRDPDEKSFTLSHKLNRNNWNFIKSELDKCDLLCHNCHVKLHKSEESSKKQKILHYYQQKNIENTESSDMID